ncbi:MAG: hypothetical protein J6T71_06725 [Paludibacteraceae bacterium]|nr:hypothetical protein [Paludibacteraceae bacterium]
MSKLLSVLQPLPQDTKRILIMTNYYCVANHFFAIEAEDPIFPLLSNYLPFQTDELGQTQVFIIHVTSSPLVSPEGWAHVHTDTSDDDMPRIEMYRSEKEWLFLLSMAKDSEIICSLRCSSDWSEVRVAMAPGCERFAVDNAAMLVYAFRTTALNTLLFHSSTVVRKGKGYLFLGHSGTGKSTHSRQWLKAFPDALLLNDDNPVVRLLPDGEIRVYGSPWSGKTACYVNDSAPVGALVQLAQAPENKIERLRMAQAYPYILGSVSGLKILPEAMDAIYESIARLLEACPVYRLECLPNEEAAQLCAQTCLL